MRVWAVIWELSGFWDRLTWIFKDKGDPNDWRLVRNNSFGVRYTPLSTLGGPARPPETRRAGPVSIEQVLAAEADAIHGPAQRPAAATRLKELVPSLLRLSKCPDFVTDRGHLFGTGLVDDEKRALITFLKRL